MSDEVIKRINNVLNDSKEKKSAEERLENSSAEKFHDVYESIEVHGSDAGLNERTIGTSNTNKDLESENRILSTQLEAERKKSRDLQSKLQLFENSAKYFERLNGQLEEIKQTVEEDSFVFNDHGDYCDRNYEAMQKLRPKTVHTAATGGGQDDLDGIAVSGEPHPDDTKDGKGHNRWKRQDREEVTFRDADDFKQLDQGLEIVRDKLGATDSETEKVFITKTEKQCLEDIGNLASRMRTPIDDKHQRYFEKDRKRFANRIVMPETQEVDKTDSVPVDIVTKTKETPVNITSTELDGLRSYLLQLKELIARRETAWARTTERDYNQRVEITRFKNEVTHLRMLCEKRQKDIKERDQMIIAKDEEIKELQKRIQSLKSTVMKLEKKDDRVNDTSDGITDEVLENSHLGQKSYNTMKKGSITNRGSAAHVVGPKVMSAVHGTALHIREQIRRPKTEQEKSVSKKLKSTSSNSNDEEPKTIRTKSKAKTSTDKLSKSKQSHTGTKKKSSIERVDEKLQQIEEMLHSDALKPEKKGVWKYGPKGESKASASLKVASDVEPVFQKFTLSSSKMRQEMLGAMTGLGNLHSKLPPFPDPKRSQGNAALLANALLSARNTNVFRL